MQRYYHYTNEKNIERILEEGLRPGVEIGHQTQHNGVICDNTFVYLAKTFEIFQSGLFNITKNPSLRLLSVEVPDEHFLERDTDIYLLITGAGFFAGMQLVRITSLLGVYTTYEEGSKIISLEKKEQYDSLMQRVDEDDNIKGYMLHMIATDGVAVKELLSRATEEKWDQVFGFYRTKQSFPSSAIQRYVPVVQAVSASQS